jgi:hypothetical protein
MRDLLHIASVAICAALLTPSAATAQFPILQAGDAMLTIDLDPPVFQGSGFPGGESPNHALDGNTGTKFLSFGANVGRNKGLIVTPTAVSTVQSIKFTSANDDDRRDPITFDLYGTNDPITSAQNTTGSAENWTLITGGATGVPLARTTAGPVIPFANATAYSSYRIVFPEIRNFRDQTLMQVANVDLYASNDGSGSSVLAFANPTLALQLPVSGARSPSGESPEKLLDGLTNTKFLNFGEENSGFVVTPASGASVVSSFQISTANDHEERDPATWALYGTNDPITSPDFSQANLENWTLIDQGAIALPAARETLGPVVAVNNAASYTSYRMVFPTVKNPLAPGADSMQISAIQFYAVPEPATWSLALVAAACGLRRRRSHG